MHRLTRKRLVVLLAAAIVVACSAALGAEAPAPAAQPPAQEPGFWSKFFDSTFALVLVFIFVPVLVTTFIAARQRDRCLKTFNRFFSTVHTKVGESIFGTLRVFSKGLVVEYRTPDEDPGQPTKTSYLMYEPDLQNLFAVFRFHDQISGKNKVRRKCQIRRLAHPGFILRTWRRIRNLINTLRDAFSKAIGALLGQMQRAKPGSQMLTSGKGQMEGIGTTLLGQVANAYEPLLEKNIGSPVVLELTGPGEGEKKEYAGHLGEYSAGYLMVLDIDAEIEDTATVDGPGAFGEQVNVRKVDDELEIANGLSVNLQVVSVEVGGQATPMEAEVAASATTRLPITLSELTPPAPPEPAEGEEAPPPPPPSPPAVKFAARRTTDIIAPRAHAIVRHGGIAQK